MDKVSIDWGGVRGAQWMGASGIIGLFVNALFQPGGLLSRIGGPVGPGGPGFVDQRILDLTTENALLKANAHADAQNAVQMAWNAKQEATIGYINERLGQLFGMTKLTVPNASLSPGYGNAVVLPAAPVPPPPAIDAPTLQKLITALSGSSGGTATPAANNGGGNQN